MIEPMHYDDYDDYGYDGRFSKKGRKRKLYAPAGVHVPNKNEAKLLRKLMSQHGLTEEEVRSHKVYRVMLSAAQKGDPAQAYGKEKLRKKAVALMKKITRERKLPKEHPLVVREFTEAVLKDRDHPFASTPVSYLLTLVKETRHKQKSHARKVRRA